MANNKKVVIFTTNAAQRKQFAPLRDAGVNASTTQHYLVTAYRAALGKRPSLTLYRAGTLELKAALMSAALINSGDNRPISELVDHCRERLTVYQGFGGEAALRAGMKGRRTKPEELAYGSARVQISKLNKLAGVTNPENRGGNTSQTRSTRTSTANAKKGATDTKPKTPKLASREEAIKYFNLEAKAMQTICNRSAKNIPIEIKSAIQDFKAAIAKLK
jgi:hypothetical protein